ncbi:zinc finger BED domain-containing protein RICESLEEPER 2-like [Herrania umbratica]|uniref:Zinc finger BED domain-containing protein RICESLEEPER 2-like n=1 Tax=Herrania umbratica TaxID=108875 RepID=A0A6J1BGI3_9ROSI|nr:zinc finger BED domain-containing protein RICESLEEPER 2-like [Herrania umbratica]
MESENNGISLESNAHPLEQNDEIQQTYEKTQGKNKRKLSSQVSIFSEHFPKKSSIDGKAIAKCKQCGIVLNCDSKHEIDTLKRYSENCAGRDTRDIGQMISSNQHGSVLTRSSNFDPEKFRELVIGAILMHNLPLSFVEHSGSRDLWSYLHEDVTLISSNTLKAHMIKMHRTGRSKIKYLLEETPGRINLTFDLWNSITTDIYICVIAHFVDKNWVLQKRILNFSFMLPPYNGVALIEKVYALLAEWGIDSKLFSVTLDNNLATNAFVELLKVNLNVRKAFLGGGKVFHLRCFAQVLNTIVQDSLKVGDCVVRKVRESVQYVKGSQVRKQKFLECVTLMNLNAKGGLRQDVPNRWNSTFLMLERALYFRMAFSHLEISDSNYKYCPSKDEWERVEKLCKLLAVFYDITCVFSRTKYPTANLFFPPMFIAHSTLQEHMSGQDVYMQYISTQMFAQFEKYWSDFSWILAIAVILDPRYKIHFVEWSYGKLYGNDSTQFKNVRDRLFSLYNEYAVKASPTPSSFNNTSDEHTLTEGKKDFFEEFDSYATIKFGAATQKSQLEWYLSEPRVERTKEINILQFWKENQYRYPELAAMARDVLSIPISAMASEFAFSVGGKFLDQHRSSLKPEILEATVCCKDWLFGEAEHEDMDLNVIIEDIVNLDVSMEEVTSANREVEVKE